MRLSSLSLVWLLLAGYPGLAAAADPPRAPDTAAAAHYDVRVEHGSSQPSPRAADLAASLEALHAELSQRFGKAPDQRLRVQVLPDAQAWADRLRADRCHVFPGKGGYYCPHSRTAYLWAQPSLHYTRQLALHEAAHQFHFLTALDNHRKPPLWYLEGWAEYQGMHTWDGQKLRVGVVPPISLEDYPAKALAQWRADPGFIAFVRDIKPAPQELSWALVHYLLATRPEPTLKLFDRLDRGEPAQAAWDAQFAAARIDWDAAFASHLAAHQQPWQITWVHWRPLDARTLWGQSDGAAVAVLKQTPKAARFTVRRDAGDGPVGVVFGHAPGPSFQALQWTQKTLRSIRFDGRSWRDMRYLPLPQPQAAGVQVFELRSSVQGVRVLVNQKQVMESPLTGRVGVCVDRAEARVEWELIDAAEVELPPSSPREAAP
jgi:hypothetical protein